MKHPNVDYGGSVNLSLDNESVTSSWAKRLSFLIKQAKKEYWEKPFRTTLMKFTLKIPNYLDLITMPSITNSNRNLSTVLLNYSATIYQNTATSKCKKAYLISNTKPSRNNQASSEQIVLIASIVPITSKASSLK